MMIQCKRLDESIFWCAMKRCIELELPEDLQSIMNFLLDQDCLKLTKLNGPNIYHWQLLFQGLYTLNDLQSALKWLNIMLLESNNKEIEANSMIFSKLIGLCCKNNDFQRGIKLFEWMNKLDIEYDKYTLAEMIKLYTSNAQIDTAQQILKQAKDMQLLHTIHYNYFLKGLSIQQRQNDQDMNPVKIYINF